jgi:hypothetical protein
MDFTFPVAKLTDYQHQIEELLASHNPFAILTAAHFLTKRTKHDMNERLQVKLKLAKLLYQKGWDKQEVIEFFSVIDWLMHLPEALTRQFQQNLADYEQESKVRYVTSIERLAIQDGIQQGIQQGKSWLLQQMLAMKFPEANLSAYQRFIDSASDDQLLSYLFKTATAEKIEDVFND